MTELILSPLVEILKKKEDVFIFHRLNLSVLEGDKELFALLEKFKTPKKPEEFKECTKVIEMLEQKEILVDKNFDLEKCFFYWTKKIKESVVRINQYRIIVTEKCNYQCKYCFVKKKFIDLDWQILQRALDLLIKENIGKKSQYNFLVASL